jgi:hypothetical protein
MAEPGFGASSERNMHCFEAIASGARDLIFREQVIRRSSLKKAVQMEQIKAQMVTLAVISANAREKIANINAELSQEIAISNSYVNSIRKKIKGKKLTKEDNEKVEAEIKRYVSYVESCNKIKDEIRKGLIDDMKASRLIARNVNNIKPSK